MRYTAMDANKRRDLPYTLNLIFYGVSGVTHPFQESYSAYLCSAIDECETKREKTFKKETGNTFIPEGALPYTAWRLDAGKNLEVFFLRRVNDRAGDVAVLKSKDSGSHLVLYGESAKRNLNEGIVDFVVKGADIKAELQQIISAWQAYVENEIPNPTDDNRHAPLRYLASQLTQADPLELVTTYLYPIEWGDESIWLTLEYYNSELQRMGLPAYRAQNVDGAAKLENNAPL